MGNFKGFVSITDVSIRLTGHLLVLQVTRGIKPGTFDLTAAKIDHSDGENLDQHCSMSTTVMILNEYSIIAIVQCIPELLPFHYYSSYYPYILCLP